MLKGFLISGSNMLRLCLVFKTIKSVSCICKFSFQTRNVSKNAHYQVEVTPFVYIIGPCNMQKAIGTKIESTNKEFHKLKNI